MKSHVLRILPGLDVYLELQKYVREGGIQAATILSCVGSVSKLSLRFANAKKETTLNENFEILNLSGTLSESGIHLHGTFSKEDGSVLGGHLKPGSVIHTTVEIVLVELEDWKFQRSHDQNTGYRELVAERKS